MIPIGADIHCYAETFSPVTRQWSVETEPNPYYTPPEERLAKAREFRHHQSFGGVTALAHGSLFTEEEARAAADDPEYWGESPRQLVSGYHARNYGLFAILAGVRNGLGFAGCKTGEPTVPIDEPRGVPVDASPQYREEVEYWGEHGHSHTYFTLAELLRYDWDGHHSVNSFLAHPNGNWAARLEHLGARLEHLAAADFDAFALDLELVLNVQGEAAAYERWPGLVFAGGVSGGDEHEWRRVAWRVTHRQQAGEKWFEYLGQLKAKADAAGRPYEFTRLVLFFDN